MILTKNRLKKIKFKDDDEMLYYLKFSHLEPIREDDILGIETSDKMTQAPERMENFAQTDNKVMVDKETDTFDELNKIDINAKYVLEGFDAGGSKGQSRFDKSFKNNKQTQVNSYLVKELESKTPPSSNSEDDDAGSFSRNVNRGLRIAQLTGSAMLTALNIADTVGNTVLSPVIDSALDYVMSSPTNEAEDEEEAEEAEADASAEASRGYRDPEMRDRSRSRDGSENDDLGNRLLSRGASRSRSVTPSSTPASSAKTTPRKKI